MEKVDLEMKASAELNKSIAKDLQKEDPNEKDAMASIQEHKNEDTSED